jgi:hypothetical protein
MSALETLLHPHHTADEPTPATPLLFVFLIPLLAIVGMVLLIGSGLTWALVAATIAAIAIMTVIVLIAIGRMLDDDGDR